MMLFHWRSTVLQNYARGNILVIADTIEEARKGAREDFEAYLADVYSYLDPDDEWGAEQLKELRDKLQDDLAADPEIIERSIFIPGSD